MATRRRHTPDQIIRKLNEGNKLLAGGADLEDVCRHLQIAESTWNRWLAQYGGMKASHAKKLKDLEVENVRVKKLLAEVELDKAMLKELAEGNLLTPNPSPERSRDAAPAVRVSERRAGAVVGQHRSTQRLAIPARVDDEEALRAPPSVAHPSADSATWLGRTPRAWHFAPAQDTHDNNPYCGYWLRHDTLDAIHESPPSV